MGYSEKHRNMFLAKVLPPNNRPVHEVSKDNGVGVQTIYKWLKMVMNDMPYEGGLGSSGALSSAWFSALYAFKGEYANDDRIIKDASKLEMDRLKGASGYRRLLLGLSLRHTVTFH